MSSSTPPDRANLIRIMADAWITARNPAAVIDDALRATPMYARHVAVCEAQLRAIEAAGFVVVRAAGATHGLEEAARVADFYAVENFRMAEDTILTDPVLRDHDVSAEALARSERLQTSGCIHASMAHAAQNIAAAIRKLTKGTAP